MTKFKIDNKEYDLENLSKEARERLQMLVVVERKIKELKMELAICQTAQIAYTRAVREVLPDAEVATPTPAEEDPFINFDDLDFDAIDFSKTK